MRGQVLGVDGRTGEGQVAGDDGRRALSLFPVPGSAPVPTARAEPLPEVVSDRNKYVAAVLAFLFGPLGIHRFYLGRTGSGFVMLLLSITVVGLVVSYPWALVDMIRYLLMSDRDFARRYARIVR